jgi:hypothetical protein
MLAVKTPIPFLLLTAIGGAALLWTRKRATWQQIATLVFPILILGVCMASNINLGTRHVLAIFPMLAVLAGHGVSRFWAWARMRHPWFALIPVLLVVWAAVDSVRVYPDFLAYFNPLAGSRPEERFGGSDLDWGQDLDRLSRRLAELRAPHVSIAYFGTAPLDRAGLPDYTLLEPGDPAPHGYVAISATRLYRDYRKNGSYASLWKHTPKERVGRSILLYDLGPE